MGRFNRRRVRRYTACPECTMWSIRVEENGRICRHSRGFGYVERFPPGSRMRATPVCKGSGAVSELPPLKKRTR
jgi:hypothetical protein